ncbi:hypothetical protein CP061683_0052B, partial [Chlamydia psittaci 06-1683]
VDNGLFLQTFLSEIQNLVDGVF